MTGAQVIPGPGYSDATGEPRCPRVSLRPLAETASAVRRHERRYYAEIHTAEFPNGAVRGQMQQYTDESEPK
jgi:hypothetical protein